MFTSRDLKVMTHCGRSENQSIDVDRVSEKFKATFIGDFQLKTKVGEWLDCPIAVFYQPTPKFELGHTHYFGIFNNEPFGTMITDASSAFSDPIIGIVADDGEVIFSRGRHDFRTSKDGSVSIDGGRSYTKYSTSSTRPPNLVNLIIDKDKLIINNLQQLERSVNATTIEQAAQYIHSTVGEELMWLITNFLDDKDSLNKSEYFETDYKRGSSVMRDFQNYLENNIKKAARQQNENEINEAISYLNKFGYEIKTP